MNRFMRVAIWIPLLAFVVAGSIGSESAAFAAQTNFSVSADSGTNCTCCPQLHATVTVDPSNGNWSVQMTQGNPPVPVSVTVVSYSEQSSTTTKNLPSGTPHTVPGNPSSPPTTPGPGQSTGTGGAVSGTSSAVSTIAGQDSNDGDPPGTSGVDIDGQTFHTLKVKQTCPTGCGTEDCVYTIKWTSTSEEGFTVTRTQ